MTPSHASAPTFSRRHLQRAEAVRKREVLILSASRALIHEHGYLGLTMDRIAEAVGISKPTVYEHFRSKEEVVMGLAIQNMLKRNRLHAKAVSIEGRPREKMLAFGYISQRLMPIHLEVEMILYANSIREKTSEELQLLKMETEEQSLEAMKAIVCEALDTGDLMLPPSLQPEGLVFSLWSLHFGSHVIRNARLPFEKLKKFHLEDLSGALAWGGTFLLDGAGWRPYSTEWDYKKTLERVAREMEPVFAFEEAETNSTA